jgi:hypothetical protein
MWHVFRLGPPAVSSDFEDLVMRSFACSHCGQLLFFENSHCLRCGTALGFAPEQLELGAMEPVGWNRYRTLRGTSTQLYRRCARAGLAACNWLLRDDEPDELCASCRLTASAPVVKSDGELRAFAQAEHAKRRLLYQLYDLGLPIKSRREDPKRGLAFTLAFRTEEQRISTGHLDGVITLDLRECDSAHRERLRNQFGEPYRTLLGHFRHEIGHYYWDVLIDGKKAHSRFRELFGDERVDYREALTRHYEGSAQRWSMRHVSAYAASHPWEDWAETFAHYLHIRDTLQTAANFGLHVSPTAKAIAPEGGRLAAHASEEVAERDFAQVVAEWLPLTYAFNAANRSMGKEDLYPFVLAPDVIEKLAFVHDIVRFVDLADAQRGEADDVLTETLSEALCEGEESGVHESAQLLREDTAA